MEMVAVDDKYDKVEGICKNSNLVRSLGCVGLLRNNFGIYDGQLRLVCESCEQLHLERLVVRWIRRYIDALYPGDLDKDV
jgi:hypothetical protein